MRTSMISIVLIALLAVPAVQAQVGPVGTEFEVNTYTTNAQLRSDVCGTADGAFVIVWASGPFGGTEVFGQRYSSTGAALGSEFQVNTYTSGSDYLPAICCNTAGDFIVVWSRALPEQPADIFGQRFASDGSFQGTEFQVNTYTSGSQDVPDICCDADGNFNVTWTAFAQDGDGLGVFAQRFASAGAFRGTEFQVNTYTPGYELSSAICCGAQGDFVIAWQQQYGQDGNAQGVFAQRFASGGTFQGSEFQVNTYTSEFQGEPAICCAADRAFVVTWSSYGQDGSLSGVFGQRFASHGTPRGTEFEVNTYTPGRQADSDLCCNAAGDFVVSWSSYGQRGPGEGLDIFVRRFASSGQPLSGELPGNFETTHYQSYSALACNEQDGFVVTWSSFNQDGDNWGIFARRFGLLPASAAPVLSWLGLGAVGALLLGGGTMALRRRRGRVAD